MLGNSISTWNHEAKHTGTEHNRAIPQVPSTNLESFDIIMFYSSRVQATYAFKIQTAQPQSDNIGPQKDVLLQRVSRHYELLACWPLVSSAPRKKQIEYVYDELGIRQTTQNQLPTKQSLNKLFKCKFVLQFPTENFNGNTTEERCWLRHRHCIWSQQPMLPCEHQNEQKADQVAFTVTPTDKSKIRKHFQWRDLYAVHTDRWRKTATQRHIRFPANMALTHIHTKHRVRVTREETDFHHKFRMLQNLFIE